MALNEGEEIRAGIVTDSDGRQVISVDALEVTGVTVSSEVEVTNVTAIPVDVTNEAAIAVEAEVTNATPIAVDAEVVNDTPIDVSIADVAVTVDGSVEVTNASLTVEGSVDSVVDSESIYLGSTTTEVKRAFANISPDQNDAEVVAAVDGKKIRVLAAVTSPDGTPAIVTFGSDGTTVSADFVAGTTLPYTPHGWFETGIDEALTADTSDETTTSIQLIYVEV